MSETHQFLALDLGAESGRGELVTLKGEAVEMHEVHRWPNRPVRMAGTLYWDLPFLFAEILQAMRAAGPLSGISVDTWGVDFGLLGRDGKLVGNPVAYRDGRTDGIHDYSNPTMTQAEIFEATAYEPWSISSLFQLLSMQRDGSPLLDAAETFLNMPDLLHYLLTGRKASEMSIANTSNLMGTDKLWADEVVRRFGLKREMFGELVEPGTVLGPLSPAVAEQTGLGGDVPVIATCGHDTSAAVAAVGGEGEHWAFLSCGTWSILGSLIESPVATPRCLELGFTNEYTAGGWYLARNILGLWLVQELKRKWDTPDDPWDYVRITDAAREAGSGPLVDAAHESLMAPADMEEALLTLIKDSGQDAPDSRGRLVHGVLESLALEYNRRLDSIAELTGHRPEAVYMVGGGTKNTLLCQLTADACGVPVYAGADQCTALGNALIQAMAVGVLEDVEAVRRVMRNSFPMKEYRPQDESLWAEKRQQYGLLVTT